MYGELKEIVFMEIPDGLNIDKGNKVCKLKRSMYGLKQTAKCWNDKFCEFLRRFKFKESESDQCLFVCELRNVKVFLALYVDDGLIVSKSKEAIMYIIEELRNSFELTIGDGKTFFGMQIIRDRSNKRLFIHQRITILKR